MALANYRKDLLNEFEQRTDDWHFTDFEQRSSQLKPGTNYQDAKVTIIKAHQLGLWPKTVKRYLLTNYKAFGNVSCEHSSIFSSIYSSLSEDEKKNWGV
ncbi:hypothetical protein [Photobacterium sp. GB-3]|uniref:hypothetical protein n=1 Tax=Photobacterium sp. GB-3 TaxID=2022110 RepID=UPI000D177753|nr:hypothetical protein [Photobacterium sp. GB-3]PSV57336.1 hypothetical protein C9J43_07015 [Photobacterium sp. GB-3]